MHNFQGVTDKRMTRWVGLSFNFVYSIYPHDSVIDTLSYLSNADPNALEALYQQYRQNPDSVDPSWQLFFQGFEFSKSDFGASEMPENMPKEFRVINLINGYRSRGHLFTRTNPVRERRKYAPTLDIANFDLEAADLQTVFQAGEEVGLGPATLQAIIDHLEETYCQSIGIEYTYIRHPKRVDWIRDRIEVKNRAQFSTDERKHILNKVNQATVFEQFLQKKFVGQKRFSVEGGEALIPALDSLIEEGVKTGVKEVVIGMAHRGRLNTLAHIFGKPYREIFAEFEGKDFDDEGVFDGDVKYHLGCTQKVTADSGAEVNLTLCPNPSHLEAVNPVVEGLSRSKVDIHLANEKEILPVLVHGDAAIAGQGIVYEVVQMAQLDGYRTGGTVHIVVNNQVGFTTNYLDGRSSTYCTDVAKTTLCPIFHVNADDVEAVVQTMRIALAYRQEFSRDVFIDLLGYRKYGHNEGDEPKFTQPKLYKTIAKHPTLRDIYLQELMGKGVVDQAYGANLKAQLEEKLSAEFDASKKMDKALVKDFMAAYWQDQRTAEISDFDRSPDTGFDATQLREIATSMSTLPESKKFFRKVEKLFRDRLAQVENNSLDWGMGELLAYASLLAEGHPVRMSGQDVERGTFSHRHAVLKTEESEEEYIPLNHLTPDQAKMSIFNSLLSEYGVMGFDYGYAFGNPNGLTIWEAQFGDFNNGAQIIIDQFISAAEDKWRSQNGLVLLLPHGYEGMGSEHSSGRMERFLQLCAGLNMQVCNCTTPANYFHVLRRQLHRPFRKPLVVFTPKKLLRYPKAVSPLEDMSQGCFQEVIQDSEVNMKEVDTIALCSGKLYYDLLEHREKIGGADNIALVRVEQLYPFPLRQIEQLVAQAAPSARVCWVQEEPRNMGAWSYVLDTLHSSGIMPQLISRAASGSPAAGSPRIFESRQQAILDQLFTFAKANA